MFNPNELVLERVRAVEEFDPATLELVGRYTQVEDSSLKTSADGTEVTDAMGSPIQTFYQAHKGTFDFTNSLFSLDLAASQFATEKVIASGEKKMVVPVSETITIGEGGVVNLKYVPVGTKGAEIKYVKVINGNNTFGKTFEVSSVSEEGKFTIDAASKKITLPEGTTGRVFVNYEKESENAVRVTKTNKGDPAVKMLLIHVIFHEPCNKNIVYAGVIRCPRAEIDPSSVEIGLKSDSKHSVSYVLSREYCEESGTLFDIFVYQD